MFVASTATSISVDLNVDVSSTSASVPPLTANFPARSSHVRAPAAAGCGGGVAGPASGSRCAHSSVPSASRFTSTAGASIVTVAIRASRPNRSIASIATAIRRAEASGVPSRRLMSSPSIRASPRTSSRFFRSPPATKCTWSCVVSAPPARSTRGLKGRYAKYDGRGSASMPMSSVASRCSANGVDDPVSAKDEPLKTPFTRGST